MTAGELKDFLVGVKPDTPIVVRGDDHSYTRITFAREVKAEQVIGRDLYEYYEETDPARNAEVVKAVLVE